MRKKGMPMISLNSDDLRIILHCAFSSGHFGRFKINNISYYPSVKQYDKLASILYDNDLRKFLEKADSGEAINAGRPLAHTDVIGEFLFLPEYKVHRGILLIENIIQTIDPRMNTSIISANAFYPHYHQITDIGFSREGNDKRVSFYTVDLDRSTWSIHCD
jgi:hypothetical protein